MNTQNIRTPPRTPEEVKAEFEQEQDSLNYLWDAPLEHLQEVAAEQGQENLAVFLTLAPVYQSSPVESLNRLVSKLDDVSRGIVILTIVAHLSSQKGASEQLQG